MLLRWKEIDSCGIGVLDVLEPVDYWHSHGSRCIQRCRIKSEVLVLGLILGRQCPWRRLSLLISPLRDRPDPRM